MQETLLVLGATGLTGREVVRRLVEREARVRALVRNPDKARDLEDSGVEIVRGDLEDSESLSRAMEGAERLFLATPFHPEQVELQGRAVQAASLSGIRHIVKLSALGASLDAIIDVTRWHALTEREIEKSGMDFTHLRPHVFMQNFLAFAPTIRTEGVFYAPLGDARVSMVDVRDIAAVAAAVLTEDGHEGKIYNITGPEALSYAEAAEALSRALEKPVRYSDISLEDYQADLTAAGLPGWMIDSLIGLASVWRTGAADFVTPVVRNVGKTPGIPFHQFARDYASAFERPESGGSGSQSL